MGYIEDRAAEGQRQALEAAKKAEMAKVMNQVPVAPQGLAAQLGYSDGSLEDAYRQEAVNRAMHNNAVDKMVTDNRAYNTTLNAAEAGLRNGGSINADQMNALRQYKDSIDAGLAAKWMADRDNFK